MNGAEGRSLPRAQQPPGPADWVQSTDATCDGHYFTKWRVRHVGLCAKYFLCILCQANKGSNCGEMCFDFSVLLPRPQMQAQCQAIHKRHLSLQTNILGDH